MNFIIRQALRYRMLVVVLSLVLLIYGGYQSTQLPIDVFPDLDRPRVVIMTECPGMAAEEVETLVSFPLESALLGATGVQTVRSQSTAGLSVVYVEFDWNVEVRFARQVVQERLSVAAGNLPEGVRPRMAPISSIMGQIMQVGIYRRPGPSGGELAPIGKTGLMAEKIETKTGTSVKVWRPRERKNLDTWEAVEVKDVVWLPAKAKPEIEGQEVEKRCQLVAAGETHEVVFLTWQQRQMELRTTVDWVARPRLLKTAGVAEVIVMGGGRKQYQVLVDPNAMLEHGVTLQQVEEALKQNNTNASGGYAIVGQRETPIRILGRLGPAPEKVIEEIGKIPVKRTPERTILLEQVARVTEGPQLKRGDSSVDGRPGVVMTITKQPHVDTRDLTERVTAAVKETEETLPADVVVETELFQMRRFIDRGIYNVGEALVLGAGLVLIILFLFLLNFRTTFISLSAIPLALVITTLVFRLISWLSGTDLSINVMTLGGIAVAMGELVDDAIVDVENIYRRLTENNNLPNPRPALRVVYEASKEIRSAIVFGTIVVILVFLPLFSLSGIEGRLFTPLGVAYITSILASLVVSLTVTPVLSYYLLPQSKATHREHDGFLLRWLKWGAAYLIRFSMRFATPLLVLTWVLVAFCVWQMTRLGTDFLPPFDEGSMQVNVTLPPGSSLEASNEASAAVDSRLRGMQKSRENPNGEILHFMRRSGRAELDEHTEPVSNTEYVLNVNPESGKSREELILQMRTELKDAVPGADIEVEQPLAHLISHMLSGVTAQIAIKVYGDDLETLKLLAERIKLAISDVPGITPPVVEPIRMAEELHIRLRPDDLAFYGVSREYVADVLQAALQGEVTSQVVEGQRRFDLLVRLEDPYRTDYPNLERLRIDLPDGRQVALSELADVKVGTGPNAVNRENGRRRIVIRCNAQGRDLGGVVADIKQRVRADVQMPEGYMVEYGGQFESQERATTRIVALALVSVVGMFFVLMMLFPSVRISLQILNAIPTAFIGGVLALTLTGQTLTVASLVGFISLGGIAVRNGILLVTHYEHLMKHEGESFSQKMILRGSLERLSPVLMTALTAGIALIPLVVGGQKPGMEILYPVATVILGGLITSTFCEFFIHPGLFWRFSGKDAEQLVKASDEADELAEDEVPVPVTMERNG